MMRVSRKLRQLTAVLLDLPQDVALDLPRVTMIGNIQMTVENHKGVLHFSSDTLRLATESGEMEISGQDMVIRQIGEEDVFVEGKFVGVKLHSR